MTWEQLLFRGESESLDFKRDQYPFVGSDDLTKGELLKDILAMANAWRTEPAHILIGVDASIFPPKVSGVNEQLDDAMLQQFVHGKTQRALKFSYFAAEIHGLSVGVIEIPVQLRPIFLRKDFGKLKANTVYLRRGSSTGEASPDEIAQMGVANSSLKDGDIQIQFAKPSSRELGGTELEFESHLCRFREEKAIPDFRPRNSDDHFQILVQRPNTDFYRELIQVVTQMNLLQCVALTATNNGTLAAKEIRVEFVLPDPEHIWEFCAARDYMSKVPKRYHDFHRVSYPALGPARMRGEPDYEFCFLDGKWHLTFEFGYLQPGRTLWSALEFYVGARQSGSMCLEGRVMADNLPTAAACSLQLTARVSENETTLGALVSHYDKVINANQD